MATVVITFFLFARFYVYKMDAAWLESQRDQFLSQREKRWSMNSQRLEEIVAELMKPISNDGRRSFDTDLSTLLEEYLTEAGLHALDAAAEHEQEPGAPALVAPNFAEVALLLQQSANIYGRKVDFLYKHVLQVSDSLLQSTQELANASTVSEEAQTPSTPRRRRKPSGHEEFAEIALAACAGAAREAEAPRPPPTLPRMYVELEPRLPAAADLPLLDYAAENIGLLGDFQVTWRLHEGFLVDELEGGSAPRGDALRPFSLLELQAAISAAAPASPPPAPRDLSPLRDLAPSDLAPSDLAPSDLAPLRTSTPLPAADAAPQPDAAAETGVTVKRDRKRRSNVKIDDIFNGSVKIVFGKDLMRKLKEMREFSIDKRWITNVVQKRKSHILSARTRLAGELDEPGELDDTRPPDRGFPGWSGAEAAQSLAALRSRAEPDSDEDDGFFEQSSGGSSVKSGELEPERAAAEPAPGADADAWKSSILRRAAAAEARGTLDVRALGAHLLAALHGAGRSPLPLTALLRAQVRHETDVSRIVLATLFLANAGNVEIVPGAPLSVDSCALRLVSRDLRACRLAPDADLFPR